MRTLPEQLLLIALDHSGRLRDPKSSLAHGLAGAALMELVLTDRLDHRDGRLVATGSGPTGDDLLDHVLDQVRAEPRARTLKWWVSRLGSRGPARSRVRGRLLEQLTRDGVLRQEQRRVLGLVPVTRFLPTDPAAVDQELAAVRAVLLGQERPDARSAALVALVDVCGLVDACVPASERRPARARARQIASGDAVGGAVRKLHQETMAAVTAAVIASTAATATGGDGGGGSA